MQDLENLLALAKSYRAAAATAPNRKIYELLLELAAEFQNVAVKAEGGLKIGSDSPPIGRA